MVLAQLNIHKQKNKVGCLPHTKYKVKSKWVKDLNERVKTVQLLGENIGINLCNLGLDGGFLDMTTKSPNNKTKIGKMNCIKI